MNAKRSTGRRLLRFVGFGLLNLFVLLVVVALAAPLFFDPNDYKDTIAEQVKQRTGRDITIVGDMSFSVLPWLGVTLGEVRLGNAQGFGETPFARLDAAEVRVKLAPLFSREVSMDTVSVKGLELNLARNAEGRSNWDDLLAATAADSAPSSAGDARALAAFALGGVSIEDAAVSFDDAASGERVSLTDVDLRTGPVNIGEPVDAELSLRFNHPQGEGKASGKTRIAYSISEKSVTAQDLELDAEVKSPALGDGTSTARVTGSVTYDDATKRVLARGLDVKLDAPALPGTGLAGALALGARGDVNLDLAQRTVTSPDLEVELAGLRHADLSAALTLRMTLAANLDSRELALDGFRGNATLGGGPLGDQPLPLNLDGDVRVDLDKRRVGIENMRVKADALTATGALNASAAPGSSFVSGSIAAPPFALRDLLARVGITPPATRDPKALGSLGITTAFHLSGRQLNLNDMTLELDGTTFTGKAAATPGGAIGLRLTTARLDVDRYLPPESAAAPPSAAGALPVEMLRRLAADVQLRIGELRYAGMDFSKVVLDLVANEGQIALKPVQANLYGGSYAGNVRIDARGDTPVMRLNEKLKNVDLHALLTAAGAGTGGLDLRGGRTSLDLKARVVTDAKGQRISADGLVLNGSIGGKAFKGGPAPVKFSGKVALDLAGKSARLAPFSFGFAELETAGDLKVGFAPGKLAYAGNLDVKRFNARALAKRLGLKLPVTSDRKAFSRIAAKAKVEGGANRIKLTGLEGQLDASRLSGNLTVSNFAKPAYVFDLSVDRLDANRYLPPAAKGKAATPGAAATALPVELVRDLDVNGTLKVGKLTVGGMKMSKVTLTASGKDGQVKLSPLGASLYGGRYDGNVSMDARGKVPKLALDETIRGIALGPLLKDVSGDAPITGTADLRAVLTASGNDTDALKRSLDGNLDFAIANGALEKVDMVNSMCTTLAALDFDKLNKKTIAAGVIGLLLDSTKKPGRGAGGPATGNRTEFTDLRGSARLVKGVARNDDLLMTSPIVRVRGAGTVNLPRETVDYRAEAELVRACAGIGKRDLAGQIIPVTIKGPIDNPKVSPEIPVGLIQALRKRRSSQPPPATAAPAPTLTPTPAAPSRGWSNPDRRTAQPPPKPKRDKRGHQVKDARDQLLNDLLKGIIK